MRKVFFIFAVAIIAILTSCQSFEKRDNRIIATGNDSLIMARYLIATNTPKTERLKLAADSVALATIDEARRLHAIRETEKSLIYNYIGLAISISEKDFGAKKTANSLVRAMAYDYCCYQFSREYFNIWSKDVSLIENFASNSVLRIIKDSVRKIEDDPILKSRFLPNDEIAQDCINGKFSEHRALDYAHIDSLNRKKILTKISDKTLIECQCTDIISESKRLQIARKAGFDYAEAFLLKTDNEKENLFFESLDKLSARSIIGLMDKYHIYSGYRRTENIIKHFNKLNVKNLTEEFEGTFTEDTVNYHFEKKEWNFRFPYLKYSLMVIHAVKNRGDFEMAMNFFQMNTYKGEENTMKNFLIQSKGKLL